MRSLACLFLLPVLALGVPVVNEVQSLPKRTLNSGFAFKPGDITFKTASARGTGCSGGANDVSTTISDDGETVTFDFSSFAAAIGPNTKPGDHTKNCELTLNVHYPNGLHFAILQSTFHGWARLDPMVNSSFVSTYYFSEDASSTAETRQYLDDSLHDYTQGDTYQKVDTVKTAAVIWAPCGNNGILNVNNRISLSLESGAPSTASGELTDDDATLSFKQQMSLSWASCTSSRSSTIESEPSTFTDLDAESSSITN